MNKRIKELAEQAESSRLEYNSATMMTERIQEFDKQKFAELIINHATECVRDVLRDEDSELTYAAATQVQNKIKDFFGV